MEPKNWWFGNVSPCPRGIFKFHVSFRRCVAFFLKICEWFPVSSPLGLGSVLFYCTFCLVKWRKAKVIEDRDVTGRDAIKQRHLVQKSGDEPSKRCQTIEASQFNVWKVKYIYIYRTGDKSHTKNWSWLLQSNKWQYIKLYNHPNQTMQPHVAWLVGV